MICLILAHLCYAQCSFCDRFVLLLSCIMRFNSMKHLPPYGVANFGRRSTSLCNFDKVRPDIATYQVWKPWLLLVLIRRFLLCFEVSFLAPDLLTKPTGTIYITLVEVYPLSFLSRFVKTHTVVRELLFL